MKTESQSESVRADAARADQARRDAGLASNPRSLLTAGAVRASAERMLSLALAGALDDWAVDLDRLPVTADFVARVTRENYPRLDVPMHSRWRHFVFAGRDLWLETSARDGWTAAGGERAATGGASAALGRDVAGQAHASIELGRHAAAQARASAALGQGVAARARAAFDLAITSVLLDAGAGASWRFREAATGVVAGRSEGLALASLRWFESGALSNNARDPLRADAAVLRRIDASAMNAAFQVADDNPLVGAEGRAALLNRLGAVVEARPDLFALADTPRPGGLFDALLMRTAGDFDSSGASANGTPANDASPRAPQGTVRAAVILESLLDAFGAIWMNRPSLDGVALGDCWPHPAFKARVAEEGAVESYVPLHKLSQWLTYSLIEPLQDAGVAVTGIDELTGLPEYRNGGLFIDMDVLVPRDPSTLRATHAVSSPFVVGMRALTVALLDRLAPLVGARLGLPNDQYLLARVLEGGTWAAGRRIAREKRADGGPPLHISSDGTVL